MYDECGRKKCKPGNEISLASFGPFCTPVRFFFFFINGDPSIRNCELRLGIM